MRSHLGYYAHHHGAGHLIRAQQVLDRCRTPTTLLTSAVTGRVGAVHLPLDVGGPGSPEPTWATPLPAILHHAPLGHRGLRERTRRLAAWFDQADPAALVVDVSVEVTLLARIAGVAPVVVRQPGARTDAPHRAAYEAAVALLAFWPAWAEDPRTPREVVDRTRYVGGTSRLEGGPTDRTEACVVAGLDPARSHVVVLRGRGGDGFDLEAVRAAARATPEHRWTVVGAGWGEGGGTGPRPDLGPGPDAGGGSGVVPAPLLDVRGEVADPGPLLRAADVVVTHAGQNAISDVAATGAALVVIAQQRPFDEQVATARMLARWSCAAVEATWPPPGRWPSVLAAAIRTDRARLGALVDAGATHAAAFLDELADVESPDDVADRTDRRNGHGPSVRRDATSSSAVASRTHAS